MPSALFRIPLNKDPIELSIFLTIVFNDSYLSKLSTSCQFVILLACFVNFILKSLNDVASIGLANRAKAHTAWKKFI